MVEGGRDVKTVGDDLYRKGNTDGLPVVPPTDERVSEMLRGTDLPRDHTFGRLGNREGILTVEKLAVNAVMAGCLPVHMPVLVSGAEAMVDPDSSILRVAVSTGSWAYLWLINGPIRHELEMRAGNGSFGPGNRASQTIGRALGLTYKNTAIIHPGEKNMGVQGSPFKFGLVAAENEEANPWEPLHVTEGFDVGESTVTFGGPNSFAQYTNKRKAGAYGIVKDMIYNTPSRMDRSDRSEYGVWAIHALSPDTAEQLSEAGLSKADLKNYQNENSDRIRADHPNFTYGPDGEIDTIPQLRTPHQQDQKHIKIIVIGDNGSENAVIGPTLPGTVTKKISFPSNWESLKEEYLD